MVLSIIKRPHFLYLEQGGQLLGWVVDPENVAWMVEQQLLLCRLHGCVSSVSRLEESPRQEITNFCQCCQLFAELFGQSRRKIQLGVYARYPDWKNPLGRKYQLLPVLPTLCVTFRPIQKKNSTGCVSTVPRLEESPRQEIPIFCQCCQLFA